MPEAKRLWTTAELHDLDSTVINLRKIRAATTQGLGSGQGDSTLLSRRHERRKPTTEQRQTMLLDADALASAAGEFFATKVTDLGSGSVEKQQWQDLLSDARNKYRKHAPITYAKTTNIDVGASLIGKLRNLSIDPEYMLNWDLFTLNNVGARDIVELLEGRVGIVSPLSGDYLAACTYRSYLDQTRGASFPLKPAAPSQNLEMVVLPADPQGNGAFDAQPEIAIYLDVFDTGNTGRALIRSLRDAYPSHNIHEPNYEASRKLEFRQSKKIKAFWANHDKLR